MFWVQILLNILLIVKFVYHESVAMVKWLTELVLDQVALGSNPGSAMLFNRTSCSIIFSLSAPYDKEWGDKINQNLCCVERLKSVPGVSVTLHPNKDI